MLGNVVNSNRFKGAVAREGDFGNAARETRRVE